MKEKEKNPFAFRFDSRRLHGGNLAIVILIIVAVGCACPDSKRDNNNNVGTTNPSANIVSVVSISPTPSPVATQTSAVDYLGTPEVQARITKGEQIYKQITSRTKLPVMFGWRASKMSLLIPTSDWKKMTKEEQINLTYFAENLVREIKIDPVPYARRWSDYYKRTEKLEEGGEYDGLCESDYIEQVGNLCDACWNITTGVFKRDGFYDEESPVEGESVKEFRNSLKR